MNDSIGGDGEPGPPGVASYQFSSFTKLLYNLAINYLKSGKELDKSGEEEEEEEEKDRRVTAKRVHWSTE